jgi:hypothetical protein
MNTKKILSLLDEIKSIVVNIETGEILEWISLNEFMKITKTSLHMIKRRMSSKQWHDGYVIRKQKGKYAEGNLKQYYEWREKYYYKRK